MYIVIATGVINSLEIEIENRNWNRNCLRIVLSFRNICFTVLWSLYGDKIVMSFDWFICCTPTLTNSYTTERMSSIIAHA